MKEGQICELDARPGRSDVESVALDGAAITAKTQDFIVAADAIVFDGIEQLGGKSEPRKGDQIEWDREDRTDVFDVLPINGVRAVDPLDSFGLLYRIHTKFAESKPLS
jgi:hypothetical protein